MDVATSAVDREKIEKALKSFAKRRLPLVPITKVRVETDVNVDGDLVLLVRFVYDTPNGPLPDGATYGFPLALHYKVTEAMGYPGYPLTYFIWQNEFEELFEKAEVELDTALLFGRVRQRLSSMGEDGYPVPLRPLPDSVQAPLGVSSERRRRKRHHPSQCANRLRPDLSTVSDTPLPLPVSQSAYEN